MSILDQCNCCATPTVVGGACVRKTYHGMLVMPIGSVFTNLYDSMGDTRLCSEKLIIIVID